MCGVGVPVRPVWLVEFIGSPADSPTSPMLFFPQASHTHAENVAEISSAAGKASLLSVVVQSHTVCPK